MKKFTSCLVSMLILFFISTQAFSQKMTWTSTSDPAKDLALKGAHHMMNAEFELAYQDLSEAINLDPNFTVALVLISNLSRGASQKAFAQRAIASASNKTEGEKLYASLADPNSTPASRRDIAAKLHNMFPDGSMLANLYVVTRATPEERFTAAQDFIKKFPDEPAMYNTIAYYYMQDKKDNNMAKQNLEKYLSMYPDGPNPYDSMGEFYLNMGDTANAKKYYSLALEKYPFYNSSINALEKMAKPMDKK